MDITAVKLRRPGGFAQTTHRCSRGYCGALTFRLTPSAQLQRYEIAHKSANSSIVFALKVNQGVARD